MAPSRRAQRGPGGVQAGKLEEVTLLVGRWKEAEGGREEGIACAKVLR